MKQVGRHLGKLCHGFCIAVFEVVLDQLQSYANLIQPVVNAFKYLTPLGLDVLTCARQPLPAAARMHCSAVALIPPLP